MRIAIISQEDSFVIPENVGRLLAIDRAEIVLVATLDTPSSLLNKKMYFLRGFGLVQASRMAGAIFMAKCADAVDSLFGYRLTAKKRSLRAVAAKHRIPYRQVSKLNDETFIQYLESLLVDLVISFSAPSKFGKRLLAAPKIGCVNLHCSFLPAYAGLLPSFWVLYNREKETGATVHFMDEKIDSGAILGQVRIPIKSSSMFHLIKKTKEAGGDLTVRVVERLISGTAEAIPNPSEGGSYFSWPTIEEMKAFRKRGGRLI